MDQSATAVPRPEPTILETASSLWHQHMTPGLLCSLLGVVLAVWLLGLLIRPRSLGNHLAFLTASLFPALLGLIGGCMAAINFMQLAGNGGGGPSRPTMLATDIGRMILYPLYGSLLSGLFLLLGMGLLLIRGGGGQVSRS